MPLRFPWPKPYNIDPLKEEHRIFPFTDAFSKWFCKQPEPKSDAPFGDWRDDSPTSIYIATAYPKGKK